jgi:hypothetical protein
MYVTNIQDLDKSKLFKCSERFAQWVISKGIPIYGRLDGICYFTRTDNLQKILKNIPSWLKNETQT